MPEFALETDLGDFLRFRHVFHNVSGFVLQPDRLQALEGRLPDVLPRFVAEIRTFTAWLSTRS